MQESLPTGVPPLNRIYITLSAIFPVGNFSKIDKKSCYTPFQNPTNKGSRTVESLVIVGGGGLGREAYQYTLDAQAHGRKIAIAGFLDDNADVLKGYEIENKHLGRLDAFRVTEDHRFFVAIAEPRVRKAVVTRLESSGAKFTSIIHPTAYVPATVKVGTGVMICPFAFIGPDAVLEDFVILNTHCSIGHDSQIKRFSVFSPYAVVNGNVTMEEGSFLGTHATVTPGKRVGAYSKVAAGSVVFQDVPPRSLAVGIPAKSREMFLPEQNQ